MSNTSQLHYRIGAVSKATGIPVSTLRVWEVRYGAFHPIKTQGKQRLFDEQALSKAHLLKQLLQQGHAIGTIAHLDAESLRQMRNSQNIAHGHEMTSRKSVTMAVIGIGLANRVESAQLRLGLQHCSIKVTDVFNDLQEIRHTTLREKPELLLVKVNTLQVGVHANIQALREQHGFAKVIVIYHFAPESVVKAMKFAGFILRREPISDFELAELLQSVVFVDSVRAKEFGTEGAVIANRKYSDETLSKIASISTQVLCECPRHVAELIAQLASFEAYSQECLNTNAQDAHLHAYLHSISGTARTLFENALEKIAQHEGFELG